jgi:hypothetical protein
LGAARQPGSELSETSASQLNQKHHRNMETALETAIAVFMFVGSSFGLVLGFAALARRKRERDAKNRMFALLVRQYMESAINEELRSVRGPAQAADKGQPTTMEELMRGLFS